MLDINVLRARHQQEMNDYNTYKMLAESDENYCHLLMDIACEEKQHACILNHIIQKIENNRE